MQKSLLTLPILLSLSLASCGQNQDAVEINKQPASVINTESTEVIKDKVTENTGSISSETNTFQSKWSSDFSEWSMRSITGAITLDLPKDSSIFALHTATESPLKDDYEKELGDFLGDFNITNSGTGKLYGLVIMSIVNNKEDQTLKDWIIKTSKTIHANYCKKFGTKDMRNERNNGKCSEKINYLKEFTNGFVWNNDFIGEPQIVSVKIPGYILSFSLGQDQSENFIDFVTDMAQSAR